MRLKLICRVLAAVLLLPFCLQSLSAGPAAESPAAFKIYMVLWRGITDAENGFMDHLVNSGGKVDFIIRDCGKDKEKLTGYLKEIRALKPDLVYTFGTTVTLAIAGPMETRVEGKFIRDIPVIFNIVGNPTGAGLVKDPDRPGRSLTGVSHQAPVRIQVERMKAVTGFKRLAVIFNPDELNSMIKVKQLEQLSVSYDYTLIKGPLPLDGAGKLNEAALPFSLEAVIGKKPDLIYFPEDSLVISEAKKILEVIDNYQLPTFCATEGPIRDNGALMGLVGRYYDMGKFAAEKALQVLEHKKNPGQIRVHRLSRPTFLVNMKTAKRINIGIPAKMLRFAELICDCN